MNGPIWLRRAGSYAAEDLDLILKDQGYRLVAADRIRDFEYYTFVEALRLGLAKLDVEQYIHRQLIEGVGFVAAKEAAVFESRDDKKGMYDGRRYTATMRVILPKPETTR